MLSCSACIRRCIDSILFDGVPPSSTSSASQILRNGIGRSPRFRVQAAIPHAAGRRSLHLTPTPRRRSRSYGGFAAAKVKGKDGDVVTYGRMATERPMYNKKLVPRIDVNANARDAEDSPGVDDGRTEVTGFKEIQREMRMFKDPLLLGQHVLRTLRQGKTDKAYDLVTMATRENIKAVVSWNHLMDYEMKHGRVASSLKIYNAMKKRGQRPDAYTYTILLRGLADHAEYPSALAKALTIYKSISADNSVIRRPSVMHTNVMLKVCARAGEIDTMFAIAADLPTKGGDSADNLTFTTILNATRKKVLDDVAEIQRQEKYGSAELVERMKTEAVERGTRMWDDIVGRWRAGDIKIDEQLVCAMGRLLLIGKEKHVDDVFALVEQSMAIPRPPVLLEGSKRDDKSPVPLDAGDNSSTREAGLADHGSKEARKVGRQDRSLVQRPKTGSYAQPRVNTLSLLIDACDGKTENKSSGSRAARQYWGVLTSAPYSVIPDATNYNDYLRILRRHRADQEATRIVCEEMAPRKDIVLLRKTFLIATSTCLRNTANPNTFRNATRLVDLMLKRLKELDVKTLVQFAELGIKTTNLDAVAQGTPGAENNIEKVIAYFNNNSIDLKALSEFGGESSNLADASPDSESGRSGKTSKGRAPSARDTDKYRLKKEVIVDLAERDKENTFTLTRMLNRALDKLLDFDRAARFKFLTRAKRDQLKQFKSHLSSFVTMAMVQRKKLDEDKGWKTRREREVQRPVETEEEREKRQEAEREDEEIREWVKNNIPRDEEEGMHNADFR